MMSRRVQRVRELLLRSLGEIIRREVPMSDSGLVSIHDIELSGDLQSAKVFVSIMGDSVQQKNGLLHLREDRKRLQTLLAHEVILKFTPHLEFELDDSIQRGNRVIEILNELEGSIPPDETPSQDS